MLLSCPASAISLPSLSGAGKSAGDAVGNAVSDGLFYSIGGGSVISQSPTSNSMQLLGLKAGINSDLMCGNFDIKTTVSNQLNGLTSGFKDLMGNVVQGATGAVTSMPAMVIQRANPGLYDMITNGVAQAGLSFDRSKLSCENLSKKLADYTMGDRAWTDSAIGDEYRDAVTRSGGDALKAEEAKDNATGEEGARWIDDQLLTIMYGARNDSGLSSSVPFADFVGSVNDGWIMNLVLGVMYILFPLSWFGMMSWTGVRLGDFATQMVNNGAKLPQTAGNEGGKQTKDAAISVITKGNRKLK
ncbi:hypothetical protein GNN02_07740 [Salmonella enterica]|nr:hypothetical protein [Salmonella enterica]ECC9264380.1 hypothetical protein [Salmonella enterica subsp. diarizonae]EAU6880345.1 hypothetical protein [Salmonella enterica]EAW5859540.1 hypothetical protein [Salmonella enterica]EAZ2268711.1 hypothetical protein [Salmonella enterica]